VAKNVATETPEAAAPTHILVLQGAAVGRLPAEDFGIARVAGLGAALDAKASTADVAAAAAAAAAAALPARISSGQVADPTSTAVVALAPVDVAAIAAAKGISTDERNKLTGIEAGAQVNPARIGDAQIANPTGTAVVGLAPVDVAMLVELHAMAEIDGGSLLDAADDTLEIDGGSLLDG